MTAAIIAVSLIAAALLIHCLMIHFEHRNICRQLKTISSEDTNTLLHSSNGTADSLIIEMNSHLQNIRILREEYRTKSHDLEQMMTNISHDLRTPLTSAMGYMEMVRSGGLSEEENGHALEIIENRLGRLEELINSFFEFSQMISRGKAPEKEELNLVSVLEEAVVHYFDDYSARGRQIMLDCSKRRIMIRSNRNMLMRVFDNLIGNSLKHGEGDLSVQVSESGGLSIRFENGLSDSEVDVGQVFDEFYTTDISRTKGNTGLGLAIAKQFTELLGGSISAETPPGRFAVTVSLPADK